MNTWSFLSIPPSSFIYCCLPLYSAAMIAAPAPRRLLTARPRRVCVTILLLLYQFQVVLSFEVSKRRSFSRHAWRAQLSVLEATRSTTIQETADFSQRLCKSWDINETKYIQSSVSECPQLCEAIDSTNLTDWLERAGCIPKKRLSNMIVRHPLLLAQALTSDRIQSIPEIMEDRLGMTSEQYDKMIRKNKVVNPQSWTRANIRRILSLFTTDLKLSKKQTIKVVSSYPQLLNYRAKTLQKRIVYFKNDLGLDTVRIISKQPMVLSYNVENQLKPNVAFLQSLGSEDSIAWRRMIQSYPQLLQLNVDRTMKPKITFLKQALKLRQNDAIHMVTLYPPIFWLRPELLQEKIDFLTNALELSSDEARYLFTCFPQVLGLSIERNLKPTIQFLKQHLTMEQLKEITMYQPSLLAYSLEKRMKPRIEILHENAISFAYSPPYLMSLTDAKFQEWYVLPLCCIMFVNTTLVMFSG